MAFQKGYVEVSLEVTAAPGCFLTANPTSRKVAKGDMAVFDITVQRTGGYVGPIYLQTVNVVGNVIINPYPIPEGSSAATVTIDTAGWQNLDTPFIIGIEASDVPYPEE